MIGFTLAGIDTGLGLALTYLLHSTLWIVGALLLVNRQPALSAAARQLVWRSTLFGPLASSTLGLAVGPRGHWLPLEAGLSLWSPAPLPSVVLRPLAPLGPLEFTAGAADAFNGVVEAPGFDAGSVAFTASWVGVALVCASLVARAVWRQRRALRRRLPVADAATLWTFERLRERAGIRHPILLTRCAAAQSPMVLSQREICLPERSRELAAEALEAVLAHELAHIERRDGAWLYATLLVQAIFWFQPLNRKLSFQLMASAELAADDRAVELTGDALGLARTLTQIAGWARFAEPWPGVAMARAGSPIVERVARLVETSDRSVSASRRRVPWPALAALAAIGACSPSVGAPRTLLQALDPSAFNLSVAPADAYPIWSSRALPEALATRVMAPPPPAPRVARHATASRSRVVDAAFGVTPRARDERGFPLSPFDGTASDAVSQLFTRAMAFSQATLDLAFSESDLRQRQALLEHALLQGRVAAEPALAEIGRLNRDVARLTARRRALEQQFQVQMLSGTQRFEARFAFNLAPRRPAVEHAASRPE